MREIARAVIAPRTLVDPDDREQQIELCTSDARVRKISGTDGRDETIHTP